MDVTAWIQIGILAATLTGLVGSAAWAVVRTIAKKIDDSDEKVDGRFDKVDFQFSKVDLKVDQKFGEVSVQIDRLRDIGNDRHITNVDRMARIEGQISALLGKMFPGAGGDRA